MPASSSTNAGGGQEQEHGQCDPARDQSRRQPGGQEHGNPGAGDRPEEPVDTHETESNHNADDDGNRNLPDRVIFPLRGFPI